MKKKSVNLMIALCFIWLTASFSGYAETKLVQTNGVSLSAFSNMRRGISVDTVQKLLKSPGEHQFTTFKDNAEYLCLYYFFDEPRVSFCLIFTNNHLKAVTELPKTEFERVPYKGTFREVPKPVDSEVMMQRILAAKDLSKTEIEDRMRNAPTKSKESFNVLPAFIITAPIFALKAGEIAKHYRINKQLAEKFDPLKVKMGATTEDLNAIFGAPYRVVKASPNKSIHIYGSDIPLRINPSVRFSWVAVTLEDGKAINVFSHYFFDKRLKEGK